VVLFDALPLKSTRSYTCCTWSCSERTDCIRTLTRPRKLRTKVRTGSCWIHPPVSWHMEASRRVTRPLPHDDYVSLGTWKRTLHYMVQSKTHKMYGIQITTINNHEAKN